MYTIMNSQANQSPGAQNTVNLYGSGSTIVTETIPQPLQSLPGYAYEFVETPQDTQPVIFQNETANIIVSAMQVQGQDDLVYFHEQPVSSDASSLDTYSIEIQEPVYYTDEQHMKPQQNVLYESPQPSQSQQQHHHIVLSQQQHHQQQAPSSQQQIVHSPTQQTLSNGKQNVIVQQQQTAQLQSNQERQQHHDTGVTTASNNTTAVPSSQQQHLQHLPSGHILKQTLQNNHPHHSPPTSSSQSPQIIRSQQVQIIASTPQQQPPPLTTTSSATIVRKQAEHQQQQQQTLRLNNINRVVTHQQPQPPQQQIQQQQQRHQVYIQQASGSHYVQQIVPMKQPQQHIVQRNQPQVHQQHVQNQMHSMVQQQQNSQQLNMNQQQQSPNQQQHNMIHSNQTMVQSQQQPSSQQQVAPTMMTVVQQNSPQMIQNQQQVQVQNQQLVVHSTQQQQMVQNHQVSQHQMIQSNDQMIVRQSFVQQNQQQVIVQSADQGQIMQSNSWDDQQQQQQQQQMQVRQVNLNSQNTSPVNSNASAGQYHATSEHQLDTSNVGYSTVYQIVGAQHNPRAPAATSAPRTAIPRPRSYANRSPRNIVPRMNAPRTPRVPRPRIQHIALPRQVQFISSPQQRHNLVSPMQQQQQQQQRPPQQRFVSNIQNPDGSIHQVELSNGGNQGMTTPLQLEPAGGASPMNGSHNKRLIFKNGSRTVEIPSSMTQQAAGNQHNLELVEAVGSNNVASCSEATCEDGAESVQTLLIPRQGDSPQVVTSSLLKGASIHIGAQDSKPSAATSEFKNVKIVLATPKQVLQARSPMPSSRIIGVTTPRMHDVRMVQLTQSCAGSPRAQCGQVMLPRQINVQRSPHASPRFAARAGALVMQRTPRPPRQSMSPRPPHLIYAPNLKHQDLLDHEHEDAIDQRSESSGSPSSLSDPGADEEKDIFKPGVMALCSNCGGLSQKINRCVRCNHKIPSSCKLVNSGAVIGGGARAKKDTNNGGGSDSSKSSAHSSTEMPPPRTTRIRKAQHEPEEIPIISLSDEEDEPSTDSKDSQNKSTLSSVISDKEPVIEKEEDPSRVIGGGIPDDNLLDDNFCEEGTYAHLVCRTIRIGSLKIYPKDRVYISKHGIRINVPYHSQTLHLRIYRHEIVKVLAHFSKAMPVIFYYIRPYVGPRVRDLLQMNTKSSKYYFDPSSSDETHRRITLLPEKIPDEVKCILSSIYATKDASENGASSGGEGSSLPSDLPCLEELSTKEANDILVKSSPPELRNMALATSPAAPTACNYNVQTILIYRPSGISINTEDYLCLDREQFINDVIIDFYMIFLQKEMMLEEAREKTHIFSTFFYKRLTQKPTRRVPGSIENDPSVSAAVKRHRRVQSWTKNVNVFEKDFIVVPINANAHWFLAIICFPGLKGCVTQDGRPVEECQRFRSLRKREKMKLDQLQKTGKATGTVTIGNTTISPVNKSGAEGSLVVHDDEEEEHRDEADSEDEDLNFGDESQGSHDRSPSPLRDFEGPVKHPCILIFDSLPQAGNSRSRVVATLRDWLSVEYQVKHNGATRDFSRDVMIGAKPKVPLQTNYYDCGLYLLQFAERFLIEPLKDYRLPLNLENWFTSVETSRKRFDLRNLLFVLMERNGVDKDSLNLPPLNLDNPDLVTDADKSEQEMEEEMECKFSGEQEEDEAEEEGMEEEEEEEEPPHSSHFLNTSEELGEEEEEETATCDSRQESDQSESENKCLSESDDCDTSRTSRLEDSLDDEYDDEEEEMSSITSSSPRGPSHHPQHQVSSPSSTTVMVTTPRHLTHSKQITITPTGKIVKTHASIGGPAASVSMSPLPSKQPLSSNNVSHSGKSIVRTTTPSYSKPNTNNSNHSNSNSKHVVVTTTRHIVSGSKPSPAAAAIVADLDEEQNGDDDENVEGEEEAEEEEEMDQQSFFHSNNSAVSSASAQQVVETLKNNKALTIKRKIGGSSSSGGSNSSVGRSSLRNMRIVKKMRTDDEDEEDS